MGACSNYGEDAGWHDHKQSHDRRWLVTQSAVSLVHAPHADSKRTDSTSRGIGAARALSNAVVTSRTTEKQATD